jgi:hypothetical protein
MSIKKQLLEALNLDKQGQWEKAHQIIQKLDHRKAAMIHAYLHRKEGDWSNARFWYQIGGSECYDENLEQERAKLFNLIDKM